MDRAIKFVLLTNIDVNDESKQKHAAFVGLRFAVNHEVKSIKKITDCQLLNFKKEAKQNLAKHCTHKKNPMPALYIAECSENCQTFFDHILTKLASYELITATIADNAKSEYHFR